MKSCPKCGSTKVKKNGMIEKHIMSKLRQRKQKTQKYICENGHSFQAGHRQQWTDQFIEHVVYIYLRSLSLNTTIDIIREEQEKQILTKALVLNFLECVADALPSLGDINRIYEPRRSGYLAFDGVWFKSKGEDIVLLVCFDSETFDIIAANWSDSEDSSGYSQLIDEALCYLPVSKVKGVYGDGSRGLLSALAQRLSHIPFQLCVVHKEMRMGQVIPIKSVNVSKRMKEEIKEEILTFQKIFRLCIYPESKGAALNNLEQLGKYVKTIKGPNQERFTKAYHSLKRDFELTLTHFDHPDMDRDNNLLECFNSCIKPRLKLMKGFKKTNNLDRYLKLFLLDFRFHRLKESRFASRRAKSPLELGDVLLPEYYNFMKLLRKEFGLKYFKKQ